MLEKLEYILVMKVIIILNWRDKRGGVSGTIPRVLLMSGLFLR